MVTDNHYRWDFYGLSTDAKPTPATSPKVVDGSTFYEADTSKLFVFCGDTWYEKTVSAGTSYTAGTGIDITAGVISADQTVMATKSYVDGVTETYTIASSDWTALADSDPYDYSATVTATETISASTIAELYNDNAVLFGTYGFAIGDITGQSVTIYSVGQPSSDVTLKVNYRG